jgi:hypothetical protein
MTTLIKVRYSSIDRFSKVSTFKTLAGARKFAAHWIGETPELGSTYAVSADGIGKITVDGATLLDLFPALKEPDMGIYGDSTREQAEGAAYEAALEMKMWNLWVQKKSGRGQMWREFVEAETAEEAVTVAEKKNPGWMVVGKAIEDK